MASEFEKNVRRIMERLRVQPSDEVWQHVEEQIRENKRKRRIIFFIIFSLIGLALAGYGIFNFPGKSGGKSELANARMKPAVKEENNPTQQTTADADKAIQTIPTYNETGKTTNRVRIATLAQTFTVNIRMSKNVNRSFVEEKSPDELENAAPEISSIEKTQILVDTTQLVNSKRLLFKNDPPTPWDSQNKTVNPDTPSAQLSNDSTASKTSGKATAVKKPQMNNQGKWKWGMNISLGASTITQDAFSFKGTSYSDAYAYSAPGSATGGGPMSGVFYGPSGNKAAFAFKAGFHAKNEISARSCVSAGLMYAYLADKIKVGLGGASNLSSGSSRSAYYSGTPQNTYTEHFHFIELPLTYDWRMSNNSNRYFSLTGGMSGSYLVSTNALVYDTAQQGVYYQDKSLFTRMHFNLMAGTAYHAATAKTEFAIGPQFSFDLTKLIKNDVDKRKYFLFISLDTRIFFDRGKKK
jgi:outer membrane protein with beta-barrel domain